MSDISENERDIPFFHQAYGGLPVFVDGELVDTIPFGCEEEDIAEKYAMPLSIWSRIISLFRTGKIEVV